jgi:hypothetical protein
MNYLKNKFININNKKYALYLLSLLFFVFLIQTPIALAKWPNEETLLQTLAPLAGIDPDELEAIKFSIKNPVCAQTIVSYTIAQDYSLIGFIGTLKTSQIQNIPNLTPLKKNNCKKSNPIENAYRFVESQGDKFLGKEYASLIKEILAEQISQGKSELDSQIASIPYIGTILSNWDCACDAAFETNFPSEKIINQKVGDVISILNFIKKGDVDNAIEKLFNAFGTEIACKFLASYTGLEAIPVINSFANQTCSSVLGKTLNFVVDAGDEILKGMGIKGYDHIAPDEYYGIYMYPEIGIPNYLSKADAFYTQCYKYFEPSSMAPSTAKKVCLILKDRYIKESIAKIDWNKAKFEVVDYIKNNLISKAQKSALVYEKDFEKIILEETNKCEKFFKEKYPTALTFKYASKEFCNAQSITETMWYQRKKAQQNLINQIYNFTRPFCEKNANDTTLICEKEFLNICHNYFKNNSCVKSKKDGAPGAVDIPCCQLGTPKEWEKYKETIKKVEKKAKDIDGDIYCKTGNTKNPLQITCSLEASFNKCQKEFGTVSCSKLSEQYKYKSGASITGCCEYVPENLNMVKGVEAASNFIKEQNQKKLGVCSLGGLGDEKGYSFDPRIIRCNSEINKVCKNTFFKFAFNKKCSFNKQGYATGLCCIEDIFSGDINKDQDTQKNSTSSKRNSWLNTLIQTVKKFIISPAKNQGDPNKKVNSEKNIPETLQDSQKDKVEKELTPENKVLIKEKEAEPIVTTSTSKTINRTHDILTPVTSLKETIKQPISEEITDKVEQRNIHNILENNTDSKSSREQNEEIRKESAEINLNSRTPISTSTQEEAIQQNQNETTRISTRETTTISSNTSTISTSTNLRLQNIRLR